MTQADFQAILQELYAHNPALKKNERALTQLITQMVKARPDAAIDPGFRARLRSELLQQAVAMGNTVGTQNTGDNIFNNFKFMTNFKFVAGTIAVLLVALVAGGLISKQAYSPTLNLLAGESVINRVGTMAFGDFSDVSPLGSRNQSGGGGLGGDSAALGMGGGEVSDMIIAPVDYTYVYTGEGLDMTDSQVTLYRRQKNALNADQVAGLLRQLNLGVANLTSFSSAGLTNFTLTENREYGYMINVDLENGTVNISQDWRRWPDLPIICYGIECPPGSVTLSPSDVPSDEALIGMAEEFLITHGIAADNYGEPVVDTRWRIDYERSPDRSLAYLPDSFTVVYPMLIDGQIAYDESGFPTGLTVTVNSRYNRVVGLYGLATQTFEASAYEAVTDEARILDILKQGGIYGYKPFGAQEVRELEVGTPALGLVRFNVPAGREYAEVYVPSYIFPVLGTPDDENYYPQNIVIPRASAIIEQLSADQPVRIMQ